jgi:hypothetical protein
MRSLKLLTIDRSATELRFLFKVLSPVASIILDYETYMERYRPVWMSSHSTVPVVLIVYTLMPGPARHRVLFNGPDANACVSHVVYYNAIFMTLMHPQKSRLCTRR